MTVDVQGIAHTGLTVADLAAALDLWCGVLGFTEERRATLTGDYPAAVTGIDGAEIRLAVVDRGGQRIELLEYAAPADRGAVRPRPCDVGATHIALVVGGIEQAAAALTARGWRLAGRIYAIDEGPRTGTRLAYLHDEDGATIELVQPPR